MGTWFDRNRGVSQGRIQPASFTPSDGSYAFVLGEDNPLDESNLSPGDFTEVRQLIDLTDYDFVGATMNTVGSDAGQIQIAPVWGDDSDEVWKFDFIDGSAQATNRVLPGGIAGFPLNNAGDITFGTESYSGVDMSCRIIPVPGAGTAQMTGVNTPAPPNITPLNAMNFFTVEIWLNFDCDSHATSWGISPNILTYWDWDSGFRYGIGYSLAGWSGGGAHGWNFSKIHYGSGGSSSDTFTGHNIQTNQGWQLYTFVFDRLATSLQQRNLLFVNGIFQCYPPSGSSLIPDAPPVGGQVIIGDPDLYGGISQARMLSRAFSPAEALASYNETVGGYTFGDCKWVQSIIIDGNLYAERTIKQSESRQWTDFVAPVRLLTGEHEVAFRLTLERV